MRLRVMKWIMQKLGLKDAYQRIIALEAKLDKMQTDIDGLKMEADILYANSLERE